jgi:hypothetical protein
VSRGPFRVDGYPVRLETGFAGVVRFDTPEDPACPWEVLIVSWPPPPLELAPADPEAPRTEPPPSEPVQHERIIMGHYATADEAHLVLRAWLHEQGAL